ncbi:HAD family hydrolase [Bacillus spongiae]|uniref:HAD family hydrolase n=1 Tax=Bacillus spongiae TaxID=2683610 RepID=A0ABU8H9P8_9BACI
MKVFGSDLDRTLIYSKRMVEQFPTSQQLVPIKEYGSESISFISMRAKEMLQYIQQNMQFIPVTTRTIEQYQRLSLFQTDIIPDYAITSNGGHILYKGKPLLEWERIITGKLEKGMPLAVVQEKIESFLSEAWLLDVRKAENLFLYCIIDRALLKEETYQLIKLWCEEIGWNLSLQGRKMYLIPKAICKWKAFKYLTEQLKWTERYAAGDSVLDLDLMKNSTYGMAPLHGEVTQHDTSLKLTMSEGIHAAEEILEYIIQVSTINQQPSHI